MRTMMIKRLSVILIFSAFALTLFSQKKDFGIWYGISAEHKFSKKLELDLSTCLRTFDNASKIEEGFLEAGLQYKLTDFLSASASYRITENIEDDDSYHLRHKWFVDLKGSVDPGDFALSLRLRFQERYKTYFEDENDEIPDSHIRAKLKVDYDIPSFKLNPYVFTELFCPVFRDPERTTDKSRIGAGFEYNITKKQSIETEYMFQRDFLPKLKDLHLLSVNYKFSF
jgi:hypothetical protein